MDPELWCQAEDLFHRALERPLEDRQAFLDAACCASPGLRRQVDLLLSTDGHAGSFLETPFVAEEVTVPAGTTLGRYRVDEKLGEGGMGAVFRAFDIQLRRPVALKILPPAHQDDPHWRQRLVREARAASALNHPNIVAIYEIGSDSGLDFIAMELVDGKPLNQIIAQGGLPVGQALGYAMQLAGALAKAHTAGVIHRDLKPGNIMVTPDGVIKVLDFGLARRVSPSSSSVGPTSEIAGTAGYMSPEQSLGLGIDHRSDLFSLGVVLLEMITGRRPLAGSSPLAIGGLDLTGTAAPERLKSTIRKLLDKDPANRHTSAAEVLGELRSIQTAPASRSRNVWTAVAVVAVLALAVTGWLWRQSARQRWALESLPEITRLFDAGEYVKAAALAGQARTVLPKDPTLERIWTRATGEVVIDSVPSGADIAMRPYRGDPNVWSAMGKTPLRTRVPRDVYVWRLRKPTYAEMLVIGEAVGARTLGTHPRLELTLKLRAAGSVPPEMVAVTGGTTGLAFPLAQAPPVQLGDFLMDRHEVTNQEYKKFVEAGGYEKREYWTQPFVKGGNTLGWEEAVATFRDATGRPGPSTWEAGDYPTGHEQYPVAGVSWYEAAAYAAFVGKTLPTAYHWTLASQTMSYTPTITAASNFGSGGAVPVGGQGALSGFGTTDMAGNVKEWCSNEARGGFRLILGGGFGEPRYMFHHTDAQSPWNRLGNFGIRCVKLEPQPVAAATARIEVSTRDWSKEKPASDDAFKAYAALYAYDKGELNAQVEELAALENWSRAKVTFDAAYGHERVTAYLFVPKHARPPYQAVVYFPGIFAFSDDRLDLSSVEDTRDFLMRSGRALVIPIYKGTYERRDGYMPTKSPLGMHRDHVIAWAKDLGRTLDYLETRNDIDSTKVAYFGDSIGGIQAAIQPAIEARLKVAILSSGGLPLTTRWLPEVHPINFVTRVTIPVLMLNGRYDSTFPVESGQRPLFDLLGTPSNRKRHVLYEGTHGVFPRPDAVRECLDWLDKYLGPVRR